MIRYKEGYKYQLTEMYSFALKVHISDALQPPVDKKLGGMWFYKASSFLKLYTDGLVIMHTGYAWDGASGPAIDDDTNMVPALEHDGMYQLIRAGILPERPHRKIADKRLRDGMLERAKKLGFIRRQLATVRAHYYYAAVRMAGHAAATEKRKVATAE